MVLQENGTAETESVIRKGVIHILNLSQSQNALSWPPVDERFPFPPISLVGRLRSVSSARVVILKGTT